jgi:hypothetical protein
MSPNTEIKAFYLPQRKVPVGKDESGVEQAFYVRGINLEDLAGIVEDHGTALVSIYDRFTRKPEPVGYDPVTGEEIYAEDTAASGVGDIMTFALRQSPALAADIISRASRGVVSRQVAHELPATVQMDALVALGELTFRSDDDLKKFLAAATKMLTGFAKAVAKAQTIQIPSGAGT